MPTKPLLIQSTIKCLKIFSLTKEFGIPDISMGDDPRYPTTEYENSELQKHINEYDDLTFWDELIERLTDKTTAKQYDIEKLQNMNREERFKIFCKIESQVRKHLARHGIDQIVIDIE